MSSHQPVNLIEATLFGEHAPPPHQGPRCLLDGSIFPLLPHFLFKEMHTMYLALSVTSFMWRRCTCARYNGCQVACNVKYESKGFL